MYSKADLKVGLYGHNFPDVEAEIFPDVEAEIFRT
jgi:hypothetical protein